MFFLLIAVGLLRESDDVAQVFEFEISNLHV